jgi:carbonic anhydrase/acetyltransferase-like protein (isoleucine patch superfamily)
MGVTISTPDRFESAAAGPGAVAASEECAWTRAPAAIIRPFGGVLPQLHATSWVAPGAVLVGDVRLSADASVWYGSVLRGDVHSIRIGARSNIQDQCVLHVTRDRYACTVGDEVTVGHRAVVHGCVVEDGAMIGIGAVVLDGARVGEGAWVGAGAVVTPGAKVRPRTLVVGAPAREVRELESGEIEEQRLRTLHYVETARAHAAEDVS